ncbi:aldo/keto reductase [Hippea alviniae]|uniref:aldo/keto reductase n=1 Tax=Hippea alviniae TaxID=1279027 RepID=UPI0003B4CCC6|nr:aldo/keto reductase [Hippea alviniae]
MDRRKSYISKIGIGTAQFGMDYGINNRSGKVSEGEVYKILTYALEVGIDLLDTASSYGKAEVVLGSFDDIDRFKIISKFLDNEEPELSLKKSLKRLNVKNIYALLAHRFESIKDNSVLDKLKDLKRKGLVKKIGASLYYPYELEYILKNSIDIDLIQVPYNVFDRRFEKYFPVLKEKGIEIHTRSAFLQGLFFIKSENLHSWFDSVKDKIKLIQEYADKKGVELSKLLLVWVLRNDFVDKVIIGVDSYEQFLSNIDLNDEVFELVDFLDDFSVNDEKIIVPSLWRLK